MFKNTGNPESSWISGEDTVVSFLTFHYETHKSTDQRNIVTDRNPHAVLSALN